MKKWGKRELIYKNLEANIMVEKSRVSLYQEQKKIKPKIEDVINELLDGDIVAFLALLKQQ